MQGIIDNWTPAARTWTMPACPDVAAVRSVHGTVWRQIEPGVFEAPDLPRSTWGALLCMGVVLTEVR